jgi:hypothetical protein
MSTIIGSPIDLALFVYVYGALLILLFGLAQAYRQQPSPLRLLSVVGFALVWPLPLGALLYRWAASYRF